MAVFARGALDIVTGVRCYCVYHVRVYAPPAGNLAVSPRRFLRPIKPRERKRRQGRIVLLANNSGSNLFPSWRWRRERERERERVSGRLNRPIQAPSFHVIHGNDRTVTELVLSFTVMSFRYLRILAQNTFDFVSFWPSGFLTGVRRSTRFVSGFYKRATHVREFFVPIVSQF